MIRTIKVSDKGQISIPNIIRQRLEIKKGDDLIILEKEGKLLIEKSQQISDKIKDDFKDILKINEQSLKDVWDNKEDEIWSKYLG